MKIRDTLVLLIAFLGIALLIAVSYQLRVLWLDLQESRALLANSEIRTSLLHATNAMEEERNQTYLALRVGGEDAGLLRESLSDSHRAVDARFAEVRSQIESLAESLPNAEQLTAAVRAASSKIHRARDLAGEPADGPGESDSLERAQGWLTESSRTIEAVTALRLSLFRSQRPHDTVWVAEGLARRYVQILHSQASLHSALVLAAARTQRMLDGWERDVLERGQHQMETAWLLLNELEDGLPPPVRQAVENANADYRRSYAPMLIAARSDDPGQLSASIIAAMHRHLVFLSAVQGQINQDLDDRQTRLVRSSREAITLWSLLLLGGFLAVCLGVAVVRRKIVVPIEKLSQVMRRLAEDDLTVPIEKPARLDEIGQMQASLRFFKVTAIRRNRLRVQSQALHAELEAMFAQLRRDLDAAATVQAALLPADGNLGNLRFRSLFLPSSVVAGDSFDIFPLADGKVAFFQLDVAGHGAPAGLGSAVAHYALSQAFSARARLGSDRRRRYETLEGLAETVNASWPKGLPYFTLLMGELDPLDGSGTLVSAGHPAPFIVKAGGDVTQLQASGVPVGILAASAYERSHFTLAPGERMVLASDGVSEAADPSGALFSESRLKALLHDTAALPADQLLSRVKAALIAWRNKEFFDDDVSMMVIERSS